MHSMRKLTIDPVKILNEFIFSPNLCTNIFKNKKKAFHRFLFAAFFSDICAIENKLKNYFVTQYEQKTSLFGYVVARNSLFSMNYFVKQYGQKTNLFVLCHCEK